MILTMKYDNRPRCETCRDLTEYISRYAPDKCIMQKEMAQVVSDDEMDNYQTVAEIWIKHFGSHEGNF